MVGFIWLFDKNSWLNYTVYFLTLVYAVTFTLLGNGFQRKALTLDLDFRTVPRPKRKRFLHYWRRRLISGVWMSWLDSWQGEGIFMFCTAFRTALGPNRIPDLKLTTFHNILQECRMCGAVLHIPIRLNGMVFTIGWKEMMSGKRWTAEEKRMGSVPTICCVRYYWEYYCGIQSHS
jgi:hypothetical protein